MIIFGLIILASEYAWAQRMLNPVKAYATRLTQFVMSQEFRAKRNNVILVSTIIIITLAYAYWAKWGATMQGFAPFVEPIENFFNIEL